MLKILKNHGENTSTAFKQETRVKQTSLSVYFKHVSCLAYSSTLKMKVIYSSETSIDFRLNIWLCILEDRTLLLTRPFIPKICTTINKNKSVVMCMLTCYTDSRNSRDIKILTFIVCNLVITIIFQFYVFHNPWSYTSSSKYSDWYMFSFYIHQTELAASSVLHSYTQSN
jgi:hypothetical protein